MRARTFAAALGCTAVLAVAGAGTALADTRPAPSPVPTAATGHSGGSVSRPAPADDGQVRAVPAGAPDTGVPTDTTGTSDTARTGIAAGAGVLVAGAGALALRRRLQGRG